MHIKQKVVRTKKTVQTFIKKLSYRQKLYYLGGLLLIFSSLAYGVTFWDKTVNFAFDGSACIRQQTFLPKILSQSGSDDYEASIVEGLSIAGYPVTGRAVCFKPSVAPQPGQQAVALSPLGISIFKKDFNVKIETMPQVEMAQFTKPLPAQLPLKIDLSLPDALHSYALVAGEATVDCQPVEQAIECDMPGLKLLQGKKYDLAVVRDFNGQSSSVATANITTLPATEITASSIKNGKTVYNKPTEIQLITDKRLTQASATLELIKDGKRQVIEQTSAINDKGLLVTFAKELARNNSYELKITDLVAVDGSGLPRPYVLEFKMSGGPKVTGINVGSYGVSSNALVTVSFDQKIDSKQDVGKLVSLAGGSYGTSKGSNYVTFSLNNLPACKDFKISINDDIKSAYGISGHSSYSFSSRTLCQRVSTIGYSVKGRPINAFYFGTGGTTVLYVGAMHGDEVSSSYLMDRFIDDLEANARSIPSNKRILVVPVVNPDGFATGSRYNANKVDLNRNFPTSNWRSDVETPDGTIEGGGGDEPLSEPESQALANFTLNLGAKTVLTYHSIGGLIQGNGAGNSGSLASLYASSSGYWNATGQNPFDYDTTGAYEDWLGEKHGIPALLIELGSHTYSQFEQNQAAMWAILKR